MKTPIVRPYIEGRDLLNKLNADAEKKRMKAKEQYAKKKAEKDAYNKALLEQKETEGLEEAVWRARRQRDVEEGYALKYEETAKGHRTEALTQKKAYNIKEAEYWEDRAKTIRQKAQQNIKDAEAELEAHLTANLTEA